MGASRRAWAALPRAARLLCAAAAIRRLGEVLPLFLVLYVDARTGSAAVAATAAGAIAVGTLLGNGVGGLTTDRLGPVRVIIGSQLLLLPALGLLHSDAPPALVVGALLLGLSNGIHRPALHAGLALAAGDGQEALRDALGLWFWAVHVGFIAGISVAGGAAATDYDLLFGMEVASAIAFIAVVLAARVDGPRDVMDAGQRALPGSPGRRGLASDRVAWPMLLLTSLFMVVYSQASSTLPLAMRADGFDETTYGLVLAVNGVLIVVLHPLIAGRVARADVGGVLAAGQLVLGIGFAVTSAADVVPVHVLAVLVWSIGEVLHSSTNTAAFMGMAGIARRGWYAGALSLAAGAGATLGPIVGIAVLQARGEPMLWAACLLLSIAASGSYLALRRGLTARLAG